MTVYRVPIIIYAYIDQAFDTIEEALYETNHDLSVIAHAHNVKLDDVVLHFEDAQVSVIKPIVEVDS